MAWPGYHHGYLYDATSWTALEYPGAGVTPDHVSTTATGIDGGNVVGEFSDDTGQHGFLYDGSDWIVLDYPGASRTYGRGIDGDNIVGFYLDGGLIGGVWRGFLYDSTNWTAVDYPGALQTVPVDIDDGNIVGYYEDGSGSWHGFLATPTVPIPGTFILFGSGIMGFVALFKKLKPWEKNSCKSRETKSE